MEWFQHADDFLCFRHRPPPQRRKDKDALESGAGGEASEEEGMGADAGSTCHGAEAV